MKTRKEDAMDLICAVLRAGSILLTWQDESGKPGVYTYPAYRLGRTLERAITADSDLVAELLRSLSYDSNPPPKY